MANYHIDSYMYPIIMYTITILALIGAIHLIYNICFCQKHCKKCPCFGCDFKPVLKSNPTESNTTNTQHSKRDRDRRKRDHYDDYDDYDMDSESFTSKICKIVCVSTVIFFLIFLFVGCYQQSTYNEYHLDLLSYHSVEQCRILFCMIAFYVYGKMLLYAYFVLRAYNMLDGSHLNYNKTTVILILSTYFIMMNFILFCMIYVHLTDDYCNLSELNGYIHQKRSIVFGMGAAVDGSMAILSVSLLIYKLFALVRQSITVHGGLTKIAPLSSPTNTPRHSILSHSQSQTLHKTSQMQQQHSILSINLHRIQSISDTSSNTTPHKDLKAIKSYTFHTKTNEKRKQEPETYEIRLSKQIQTKRMTANRKTKHTTSGNVIMNSIRRCSRSTNDSADDSKSTSNPTFSSTIQTHTALNHSNPSSTRQSLQSRRISRSITPDVEGRITALHTEDDVLHDVPELELQTILSNEHLPDSDINKVKKLSIGMLLQKDELIELTKNEVNINDMDDIDENMRFDMIEEDETDKMISPEILLTLGMNAYNEQDDADDEEDDDYDAEDELKALTPLHSFNNSIPLCNNSLRDFPSSDTLKIPSNSTANSNSPRNSHSNVSQSPRNLSHSKSKSKSPRNSIPSLSKRSLSLLQMMNMSRASQIASSISTEHIRRFHSVTQYDNEILLLSTKLLILLTVCVISSFCSFLLLFGIIRTKQNSGIFFVYGIDSFINVWCLAFTFKFSNKCYNILFNCGRSNRSTKLCFPIVKTAALTWTFCCCNKHTKVMIHAPPQNTYHRNGDKMNGMHRVSQSSMTSTYNYQLSNTQQKSCSMIYRIEENNQNMSDNNEYDDDDDDDDDDEEDEDRESTCHMNCCFCCWGNEQEIQIYHMARGEVELMLRQNTKLYR